MSIWYDTETGEVFDTKEDAIKDAIEQFDYGDPTNPVTFDELPYIEISDKNWEELQRRFGGNAA